MPERAAMTTVLSSLGDALGKYPWQTKYVLFPSPRQASVALRALARLGTGWVNAHGMSVSRLAATLAEPMLSEKGLTLLSPVMRGDLVERAWAAIDAEKGGRGGLSLGPRTAGAVEALTRTITDLRMAGIAPAALEDRSPSLAAVYERYVRLLGEVRGADRAIVFETALSAKVQAHTVLIFAAGVRDALAGLEERLVGALVKQGCTPVVLSREEMSREGAGPGPRAPRLSWIGVTEIPPSARKVGPEVEVFRAASPWCEVREIWRRILAGNGKGPRPLDHVEVALIDEKTYAPLLFEIAAQFSDDPLALVTFEHGIRAGHTRPARCLKRFLEWVRSGFEASVLHALLASGDLPIEGIFGKGDGEYRGPYTYRLARVVRNLGAFQGIERGRERISAEIAAAEAGGTGADEDGEPRAAASASRIENARHLYLLFNRLTEGVGTISARSLSEACCAILSRYRPASDLEGAARIALDTEIKALGEIEAATDRETILLRFADAIDSVRVHQSHPAPGRVHVTNLASAGLDARPLTFVPGMDDANYPGTFIQDPFLRDSARTDLDLKTRFSTFEEQGADARAALARLRGTVVVSWPARDIAAARECFPSRVILDAWRLGPGKPDASYSDILKGVGEAEPSYLPAGIALTRAEDLIAAGISAGGEKRIALAREDACIARGLDALAARASDAFTEFDGRIGAYRDPCADPGLVFSPSKLAVLAGCPFRFFLERVLGLQPADDLEWNPLEWLDPRAFGELMHEIFRRYGTLVMAGERPDVKALAAEAADDFAARHPCPSDLAFEIEMARVGEGLEVFARTWERLARNWTPIALEMSFGMGGEGAAHPDPVKVPIGGGRHLLLRGRIDRVDVGKAGEGAAVWDYKTGGAFDPKGNFGGGRYMQPVLYAYAVEALLKKEVTRGAFLFTAREGQDLDAEVDCGPEGRAVAGRILACLCETTAAGDFPPTAKDCEWCDVGPACMRNANVVIEKVRKSAFAAMEAIVGGKRDDRS